MKFYLSIDDTDNLDSIGTGTIAEQIREKLVARGYGPCSLVTRHQLYIHEDIPYTSHNSSMCFCGEAPDSALADIIEIASDHLDEVAAEGSDPGLCVLEFNGEKDYQELIAFGKDAKKKILDQGGCHQMRWKQPDSFVRARRHRTGNYRCAGWCGPAYFRKRRRGQGGHEKH